MEQEVYRTKLGKRIRMRQEKQGEGERSWCKV
jgi:hypothetical protein